MQFSMKQFLTGILNSDSYHLSAYSKGHRSLEAIGGVRPRYVGVTWARAATRIRTELTMQQSNPTAGVARRDYGRYAYATRRVRRTDPRVRYNICIVLH